VSNLTADQRAHINVPRSAWDLVCPECDSGLLAPVLSSVDADEDEGRAFVDVECDRQCGYQVATYRWELPDAEYRNVFGHDYGEPERRGPLPQWRQIDTDNGLVYEATGTGGHDFRLWPEPGSPQREAGWWLAPCTNLDQSVWISGPGNLYYALDLAGMRISAAAVRADPDGARRQLGLDSTH
jgi:hypothetical protein